MDKKRKGWSDHKGKRMSYKNSADHSYDGKEYGSRKGWGDKEGSRIKYNQRGGSAQNSDKFKKRRGWNDHGVEHAYEDGGIVGAAKRNALMDLKSRMSSMGGDSLFDSLGSDENAYKDGGVVKASVMAKDEKGLKKGLKKAAKMMGNNYEDGGIVSSDESSDYESEDSGSRYDGLSREELLELLKNR